ncbi:MAG: sterol desaturase family protein [Anaerolineae bacterium]|nr:sterol desaturase family protein [Anaerolineae bacterium]
MRRGYLKFLKRYHMMHHFKQPDAYFGVSSPLWDMVFGTRPDR